MEQQRAHSEHEHREAVIGLRAALGTILSPVSHRYVLYNHQFRLCWNTATCIFTAFPSALRVWYCMAHHTPNTWAIPCLYQKRPPFPHSHSHGSTPSGTASPYHFNSHQAHPHPGAAGSRTDTPPVIGVPPPSPAAKGSGQHGHHQAPPHSQAHLPTHPNTQTHHPSRLSMSVSISEHEASACSLTVALIYVAPCPAHSLHVPFSL